MEKQRVVARFIDGRLMKGFVHSFSPCDNFVSFESESSELQKIGVDELKAIFFVKTYEGDRSRSEKKSFVLPTPPGKRVFVKFKDGESMMGYIEGEVPWEKGFFLEPGKSKGFFLIPVDSESNNMKVFVVAGSVWDVSVMG